MAAGAMIGMMDVGKRTLQDRNLCYVDSLTGGFPFGEEAEKKAERPRRDGKTDRMRWMEKEERFSDIDLSTDVGIKGKTNI